MGLGGDGKGEMRGKGGGDVEEEEEEESGGRPGGVCLPRLQPRGLLEVRRN